MTGKPLARKWRGIRGAEKHVDGGTDGEGEDRTVENGAVGHVWGIRVHQIADLDSFLDENQ